MCGIAGIYLNTPNDPKLPPEDEREAFINGLLKGIEYRGKDATGIVAVQRASTQPHLEKADVDASTFIKWRRPLPEQARIILCHTRAATKGSPTNLDNDHPVVYKTCYVTHNGHIRNDDDLFEDKKLERIGQVDSEIIPALIHTHGLDKVHLALQELEGGFAIAAIQPEQHPDVLVLAKGRNSPLVYIETEQGLIWASVRSAIQDAWKEVWGQAPADGAFNELKEGELLYVEDGKIEKLEFKVKQYTTMKSSSWRGGVYTGGWNTYNEHPYQERFCNVRLHKRTCKCGHSQWKHGSRWEGNKTVEEHTGLCLASDCRCMKFEFARFLSKREWKKHEDYKRVQEARVKLEAEKKERRRREDQDRARIAAAADRRRANDTGWAADLPEIKGALRLVYESGKEERKVYDDGHLVAVQFLCDGCDHYRSTRGRAKMGGYSLCVECWGEECDLCGDFFDPQSLTKIDVGSDTAAKDEWYLCRTCYNEANVADDTEFKALIEAAAAETRVPVIEVTSTGVSKGQRDGLVVDNMAIQLAAEELGCKSTFLYELLFDMDTKEIEDETWLAQAYTISMEVYRRTLQELRQGLPTTTARALRGSEDEPQSVGEAVNFSKSEVGVRVFTDE